jgi:RNA polymerase sigma-70 factor (ECF subfamily)
MSLSEEMLALAPRLRAYAWVLTQGRADADDLVQEALLRAWQFRHTFKPGTNLKAWLFHILRNVHLASVSEARRTVQDVDGRFTARLAQEPDQEWRAMFGELAGQLARLPPQNREAVLLVAGSGLTYEEAAEICGVAPGTIKSRVSRAREALAAINEPVQREPEPLARRSPLQGLTVSFYTAAARELSAARAPSALRH